MRVHTSEFKNQIKKLGKKLEVLLRYNNGTELVELNGSVINSVSPSFEGGILSSVMKELEIDVNEPILIGIQVECLIGVKVGNSYEYMNFGKYIVRDLSKQEDTNSYILKCNDFMLLTTKDYVKMPITYPISVRDYINAISLFNGIQFKNANETFVNYNKMIQQELYLDSDNKSLGYTFRDVLDELAVVTSSTICINNDNQLEIRYITDTNDTLDEGFFNDTNVSIGKKVGPINKLIIARAADSDYIYREDSESITQNGKTEIKISDNQLLAFDDREDYIDEMFNKLNGLEYYLTDMSTQGVLYLELCDRFNVEIFGNTYSCVMLSDEVIVNQGLEENIYCEEPKQQAEEFNTNSTKEDRRTQRTEITIDKMNNELRSLAQKIVDVSNIVSGTGQVQLINAHEGGLHYLSIKGNISMLFPLETLYPSESLYPIGGELLIDNVAYDLDLNYLRYIDNEICDEFVYEEGTCKIIRRVGIDNNNQLYELDREVIEQRKPITLEIKQNSIIKLKSFNNGIYKVEYLLENVYTNNFATTIDVKSEIVQTNNKIEQVVSQVADENGNVTSGSIILAINKDESQAVINADKINLEGKTINMTSENIKINSNNFKVDENGNVFCNGAEMTGAKIVNGSIEINQIEGETQIPIYISQLSNGKMYNVRLGGGGLRFLRDDTDLAGLFGGVAEGGVLRLRDSTGALTIECNGSNGRITCNTLYYYTLVERSKEELKKNFESLSNAIDILKTTDIYKYNFKYETNNTKKHIGTIIGPSYKCNEEIISEDKEGIDLYAMVSVLWQVVKEQQIEIENLREMINNDIH